MSFLKLEDKTFLITGIANKKSVATFVATTLKESGAKIIFSVQNEKNLSQVQKIFPNATCYICDVEKEHTIKDLADKLNEQNVKLDGLLHSIAFANFSEGFKPFHETKTDDFLQATNISCFSLVNLSKYLKDCFNSQASIVTISISNTRATNYGYLGPIKAALDSAVSFLAKSFSEFSNVRFNALCSGPLKTSASAGIPNYLENYLFAEQLTMRHQALQTQEVADVATFLLSPRSSGINAANLVVDQGMSSNYFDKNIVAAYGKTF
ncbi:MAG: enoyl-ACP reductase FabI [Bacteriovoracia bacterium]